MNNRKPREIALAILGRVAVRRRHVEELVADALGSLAGPDRGLCQELVYGVIRWRHALDWLITQKTQGRPQKPEVEEILRLGLYQLLWLDRIPVHAAVNETVDLARQAGFGPQSGFVNALLRGYARDLKAAREQLEGLRREDPAVGWSHPRWLWERWQQRWGEADARRLLEWNNRPAELFARVNTLKTEPGRLLERWRLEEETTYDFVRLDWLEENLVFRLKEHPPLPSMGTFRDGWFYVQDPSTLLAPAWLAPQRGDRILDLCAAPGGKTTYLAQCARDEARIVARDTSSPRLAMLRDNCRRLGIGCVEVESAEKTVPVAAAPKGEMFDRILVDAPCSNTGVIRRRVEVRYRVTLEEIRRLQTVQGELLDQAANALAPGGVLVYSTCSLEPEENAEVVQRFLGRRPEFQLERERELLPFRDGVDGAYVARLSVR